MRKALLLTCCYLLTAPRCMLAATPAATTAASTGANATALITQLSTAFSGGNIVHQIQLTGNASWHVGSVNDTGSATLSAATTGTSQVQLSLSSTGTRVESQSGQGINQDCTWSGEDSVAHEIDPGNCWRPVVWFLPSLSLQPSLLPSYLGAVDLGSSTVGFGTETYRHLQSDLVLPDLNGSLASDIMQRSTADIGLDPVSFLPAVLSYSIRPDNGAPISIAVEIHYGNYQAINGVQIPFTIQRYINGSLQLQIDVNSAQVN
jgi:hypothetical protein